MFLLITQAIVVGNLEKFKAALEEMKRTAVPKEHCLNVCEMVLHPAADRPTYLPMTLLAYAGYYARDHMMKHLISDEARTYEIIH